MSVNFLPPKEMETREASEALSFKIWNLDLCGSELKKQMMNGETGTYDWGYFLSEWLKVSSSISFLGTGREFICSDATFVLKLIFYNLLMNYETLIGWDLSKIYNF